MTAPGFIKHDPFPSVIFRDGISVAGKVLKQKRIRSIFSECVLQYAPCDPIISAAVYVSLYAILWYLDQKNVPYPSDEEMDRGVKWAASHMARDILGTGKR